MNSDRDLVYIVEDDINLRRSLRLLLTQAGYRVDAFATAEELLVQDFPETVVCCILDLKLPGMTGLEAQERLSQQKSTAPPVIVISGHADVSSAVRAMRLGALDFLQKPFATRRLLTSVAQAADAARAARLTLRRRRETERRYARLTRREQEVLRHLCQGETTKEIAQALAIAPSTVDVHRSRIMRKFDAASLGKLLRVCIEYLSSIDN